MYPPAMFSDRDLAAAVEIARATKFATVVVATPDDLVTVHAPFTPVDSATGATTGATESTTTGATFVGHVLRSNPLTAALAAGPVSARLIFLAAQGYVSPSVYAEKRKTGKVVPTWNYVAAHLDGALRLAPEAGALRDILAAQVADYEGWVGSDWQLGDAPADFVDKLSHAIVGLTFAANTGLAIVKLSQNRPDEADAVTRWLDETRPKSAEIGDWMRRHWDAEKTAVADRGPAQGEG